MLVPANGVCDAHAQRALGLRVLEGAQGVSSLAALPYGVSEHVDTNMHRSRHIAHIKLSLAASITYILL